jgi:hypothetical protein
MSKEDAVPLSMLSHPFDIEQQRHELINESVLDEETGRLTDPHGSPIDKLRYATKEDIQRGATNHIEYLKNQIVKIREGDPIDREHLGGFEILTGVRLPAWVYGTNNPHQLGSKQAQKRKNQVENLTEEIRGFSEKANKAISNYNAYVASGNLPLMTSTDSEPYFDYFHSGLVDFEPVRRQAGGGIVSLNLN